LFLSDPSHGSPALGTIALNGTPIAVNQVVTLSSLSGMTYMGGTGHGIDKIWLQAFNGSGASNLAGADISDPGSATVQPGTDVPQRHSFAVQQLHGVEFCDPDREPQRGWHHFLVAACLRSERAFDPSATRMIPNAALPVREEKVVDL
jgi:hypothetical protein